MVCRRSGGRCALASFGIILLCKSLVHLSDRIALVVHSRGLPHNQLRASRSPVDVRQLPAGEEETSTSDTSARRSLLAGVVCGCIGCVAPSAQAEVQLVTPSSDLVKAYDKPRDKMKDAGFANGMNYGMVKYEAAVAVKKAALFKKFFAALPQRPDVTIVELGMGTFPNAPYFLDASAPPKMDIVGVDPNDYMEKYAKQNAASIGLDKSAGQVRFVHGVSEALPFADASVDGLVCTLTLCSVPDVDRGLSEIKRVLKPGGKFLFHEHVISETDKTTAALQMASTPMQVQRADGCHLDRRTLQSIKSAGFAGGVDGEYFELSDFAFLNPTVEGIATA